MFTKPANLQPATKPTPGHRGAHRPKAALAGAAAAATSLTTGMHVRPILRRAALAAAGAGAAATLALGPSDPALAAAIPIVNTTNQAGYQVGNHAWNFRYVQAVVTLPKATSPQFGCPVEVSHNNYLQSSLQLISATNLHNVAIGVNCHHFPGGPNVYHVNWAQDYSGNTNPNLNQLGPAVFAGDRILLKLYYNQGDQADPHDQTVQFTACYAVGNPAHCKNLGLLLSKTWDVPTRLYKQVVLSANVANPLPHPPPPNTRRILMRFTDAAVTTYNGTHGSPGIKGPWGVQQENESELPFGGNPVARPLPLPLQTSFDGKAFNIAIYGQQSFGS
jgi:hypothetical protein